MKYKNIDFLDGYSITDFTLTKLKSSYGSEVFTTCLHFNGTLACASQDGQQDLSFHHKDNIHCKQQDAWVVCKEKVSKKTKMSI